MHWSMWSGMVNQLCLGIRFVMSTLSSRELLIVFFFKNKFLNPVMIIRDKGTIGDFLIKIKEVYCVVSSLNFITIKGY